MEVDAPREGGSQRRINWMLRQLTAPMGTKRNGLRKAFVPSVNDAVEAFYARVVQGLRPTPPKISAEAAADAIDAVDRAVDAG